MNVRGGEDRMNMIVLQGRQFVTDSARMVIVDQRYRAKDFLIALPFPGHQFVADHVPHELGAIGILRVLHHLLELLKQIGFDGKTKPFKTVHDLTPMYEDSLVCNIGVVASQD